MKKFYFYGMVLVCLFCSSLVNGQTRYWVGPSSGAPGNWSDPNNWSATSGGAGMASVPNASSFNVVFDQDALVNVDMGSFSLNSITVTGNSTATLVANAATNITVVSGSPGSEGLRIETGSRLNDSCAANVAFNFTFANGAGGLIDGTWYFAGATGVNPPNGATFVLPATTGQGNRLDVNGTIIFRDNTIPPAPTPAAGQEYLFFNSGSEFWLDRNEGATPDANWDANSTIRITGVTTVAPVLNLNAGNQIGNLIIDCPDLDPLFGPYSFSLFSGLLIQGNLQVLNTNGADIVLLTAVDPDPVTVTVGGNVTISGNSRVYVADDAFNAFRLQVNGDFNLDGGAFLMQYADGVSQPTVLGIAGNLNFTDGTFDCTSNSLSSSTDLFVVEMNGTSGVQTITAAGPIDNINNMITLRIDNSAGVTLLSPVAVGKVSWNSDNAGIINTTAVNYLTINNPDASDPTVINSPSDDGYVSGPVRRVTNSTDPYPFPTGKGGVYRYCEVVPQSGNASTYTAEYFNAAHPNLTVALPLSGVSNTEYWQIGRISGELASVQLTLNGSVPGAAASDGIVVARFNGSAWTSAKGTTGTTITPGTASSGTVLSDALLGSVSPYTLGFGPAGSLPIYLVSFNAKKLAGSKALITWTITENSTPAYFEVLRSTDGNHYESIGKVPGVDYQVNYELTDNNLPIGNIYYRLRMVDVTGDVKLSKVAIVSNGVDGLFLTAMTPTIVTDRARVSVSTSERGNLQLVVTDMYGRVVKQQINGVETGTQEIWMDLRTLPNGAYNVVGYLNGKRSSVIRFIRQ